MEVQGYQKFPLSKSGVGQNIALHAASAGRTSTGLLSLCLPDDSFNFVFTYTNLSDHKQWKVSYTVDL